MWTESWDVWRARDACPSGVEFGNLLTPYRGWAETRSRRSRLDRLLRVLLLATLPYPARFRCALLLARLLRPIRGLLPARSEALW